ncbi:MAG: hypothetical protein KID04_10725 [Clostridium sp.]|nr:hypothetical protein [Clostridium sp.]
MRKHFAVWTSLLLVLFVFTACNIKGKDTPAIINQNVIQVKEFEVSTDLHDDNTVAKGNIYVIKNDSRVKLNIVAAIAIGEHDWGGVFFYFPEGWNIVSALSSFPDGSSNESGYNAAIWNTPDTESEWKSYVEIGHELSQTPIGGGTGTVSIELISDENNSISDGFELLVSVGSELKDGMPIVGTSSTSLQLEIGSAE